MGADVFKQYYYTVVQLRKFCNQEDLSTAGVKEDLNDRIKTYLESGLKTVKKRERPKGKFDSEKGITATTLVVNYKTDQATRAFFSDNNVKFRSSIFQFIRDSKAASKTITYGDLVALLKKEEVNRKKPGYKTKIPKSTELNQFTRDYAEDKGPKEHKLRNAWNYIKSAPGPKTYAQYRQLTQKK